MLRKKGISASVSDEMDSILPTLCSLDYFMEPPRNILKARELSYPGYCSRVENFTIGRVGYGQVKFFGETDVRGLELDNIVKFRKNQLAVYEEEGEEEEELIGKPAVGYGLNKSAEVILIIDIDPVKELGVVEDKLRQVSKTQGADFVSFNPHNREWKFSVCHFSRFGLSLDDEEDEEEEEEKMEVIIDEGEDVDREGWLCHSLPAHLGLDAMKLKELKTLMFPEEEGGEDSKRETPLLSWRKIQQSARRKTPVPLVEYSPINAGLGSSDKVKLSQHKQVTTLNTVRDNGFSLNLGGETPMRGMHSGNVVDVGLFMGQSFGVGWGPNGVLVHSGSSGVLSSIINIEKAAIDGVVRGVDGEVVGELVDSCFLSLFELHYKDIRSDIVEIEVGSYKLKLREAVADRASLPEICQHYIDVIEKRMSVSELPSPRTHVALVHQITAWELIRVLFSVIEESSVVGGSGVDVNMVDDERTTEDRAVRPPTTDAEAVPLVRRAEFSCWLQACVSHRVRDEIGSSIDSDGLDHVLLLLTGRQIHDAVEAAMSRGEVRLACLLSQAGGSTANRRDVAHQLGTWRSNGMDFDFLDERLVRVLELLSGDVHGALGRMDVDWKRFLGALMWYHFPPDADLPSLFGAYHRLVTEGNAPHPSPVYSDEMPRDEDGRLTSEGRFDLAYYLMLLHATGEGAAFKYLKEMFCALASTWDPFDHHMIWHQRSVLEAVGVFRSHDLHVLDMGVVSQLLCLGQCHWAIYVALHLCRREGFPCLQASLIREILFQYCEIWSSQEEQHRFIESLDVPPEWLHESMAVYYNYYGDLPKAMEHFMGCSNWQKAHSIFITSVSHSLFLMGEEEKMVRIVAEMEDNKSEIENWELGAGLYSSFFFLKGSLGEADDSTVTTLEDACGNFFSALKESLTVLDERLPFDARVVYSKMAGEVCSLLLSVRGDETTVEGLLGRFGVAFTAPVSDHVSSRHFQDAVSTFACCLTQFAQPPH